MRLDSLRQCGWNSGARTIRQHFSSIVAIMQRFMLNADVIRVGIADRLSDPLRPAPTGGQDKGGKAIRHEDIPFVSNSTSRGTGSNAACEPLFFTFPPFRRIGARPRFSTSHLDRRCGNGSRDPASRLVLSLVRGQRLAFHQISPDQRSPPWRQAVLTARTIAAGSWQGFRGRLALSSQIVDGLNS